MTPAGEAVTQSTVRAALKRSVLIRTGRAVRASLGSAADTAGGHVRNSALFRWLTKEPEPEVIVIDLRETRLFGPCLGVLDDVVARVEPAWTDSRVKAGVDRVAALVDRGLRTRPGRLLVTLLEPPEPPKSDDEEGRQERLR